MGDLFIIALYGFIKKNARHDFSRIASGLFIGALVCLFKKARSRAAK